MVARIIKGRDIAGLIKYNEKVKSTVLYSQYINDAKDHDALTRRDKIEVFEAYIRLNPVITKPTFHVSLNPDPQDQLDDDQLLAIGRAYMEGMHYGQQPYLIYKHADIDRVHIHIVSVNIGIDGKVINSSKERYRSEAIRKQLEDSFQLRKAGVKVPKALPATAAGLAPAIVYGKTDTKNAIARVLHAVTRDFFFSSLAEFRSLLHFYHIAVDEVKDGQASNKTLGLCYAITNEAGQKVSRRIRASKIAPEGCLTYLSEKFEQGAREFTARNLREDIGKRVITLLEANQGLSPNDLRAILAQAGLQVVYPAHKRQSLLNLAFIDAHSRVVLNGLTLERALPLPYLQLLAG